MLAVQTLQARQKAAGSSHGSHGGRKLRLEISTTANFVAEALVGQFIKAQAWKRAETLSLRVKWGDNTKTIITVPECHSPWEGVT